MPKLKDLTGQRFGRLVVIARDRSEQARRVHWLCKCDCGELTSVGSEALSGGKTLSCGCLRREKSREKATKHGYAGTPLYKCWKRMKKRCFNPNESNFEHYGGRGITVCDAWLRPEPFIEWALANGYREGLSIDRIDVNGNYEPANCRWVTLDEQKANKRNSRRVTLFGEQTNLNQIEKKYGVCHHTISARLAAGFTPEEALLLPMQPGRKLSKRVQK